MCKRQATRHIRPPSKKTPAVSPPEPPAAQPRQYDPRTCRSPCTSVVGPLLSAQLIDATRALTAMLALGRIRSSAASWRSRRSTLEVASIESRAPWTCSLHQSSTTSACEPSTLPVPPHSGDTYGTMGATPSAAALPPLAWVRPALASAAASASVALRRSACRSLSSGMRVSKPPPAPTPLTKLPSMLMLTVAFPPPPPPAAATAPPSPPSGSLSASWACIQCGSALRSASSSCCRLRRRSRSDWIVSSANWTSLLSSSSEAPSGDWQRRRMEVGICLMWLEALVCG